MVMQVINSVSYNNPFKSEGSNKIYDYRFTITRALCRADSIVVGYRWNSFPADFLCWKHLSRSRKTIRRGPGISHLPTSIVEGWYYIKQKRTAGRNSRSAPARRPGFGCSLPGWKAYYFNHIKKINFFTNTHILFKQDVRQISFGKLIIISTNRAIEFRMQTFANQWNG